MNALQGKVVIVTGAGAGIGLGILRVCVAQGARAYGLDLNPDGAGAIEAAGGTFQQADVSDVDGFANAIKAVREQAGRLDGIVNNAGYTPMTPFLDVGSAEWDTLWQVNQRSVLVGCQAAARIMVADGTRGALVNVASNHAFGSDAEYEGYAGTKGAILAMGHAMAWSLGPHGIRVNTLCPGLTLTEKIAPLTEDPAIDQQFRSWHALHEACTPEDIGNVAAYLLSDASAALTGTDIVADKGMSARLGALTVGGA